MNQCLFHCIAEVEIHPEFATEVDANTTALLTCVASGSPLPSIIWRRNGSTLHNISDAYIFETRITSHQLTFVKSVLEICGNSGDEFSCTADNVIANDTFSFDLFLNKDGKHSVYTSFYFNIIYTMISLLFTFPEPYPATVVLHPAEATTVIGGDTSVLTCVAYGVPIPSLTWHRDGIPLNTSSARVMETVVVERGKKIPAFMSILELCKVVNSNGSTYSCVAKNVNSSDMYETELTVISTQGRQKIFCS